MYKKYVGIVVIAFSFAFSQVALANDRGCGEGLSKMVQSLKLDDAQKSKIQPILDQLKSSIKDNVTQMDTLDTQITQQTGSATMDQDTVNGLIDQKTKLIGDMIKAKMTAKQQISIILTDKQKTALQAKMKQLEDKIATKYKNCHDGV